MTSSARDNWRLILLVLLLAGSTVVLFFPGFVGGNQEAAQSQTTNATTEDGATNLKYGIELSGGTRIRAPLVGLTAEGVDFDPSNTTDVERGIAGELDNVSATDVNARPPTEDVQTYRVEVTADVTENQLAAALENQGYDDYDNIRDGVTEETRQQAINVLQQKINEAGLSGGSVREVTTSSGEEFILVEVPNRNRGEVLNLVESRGKVQVDIYYPVEQEDGTVEYQTREAVLQRDDFQSIGGARQADRQNELPYVPVVIEQQAAEEFQQDAVETGVAQQRSTVCRYEVTPNQTDPCLLTKVDGEVVYSAGMNVGLGSSMVEGTWAEDPQFVLQSSSFEEAQRLSINLRAGALPAPLDIGPNGDGTTTFISPTQGETFKFTSLISGVVAVIAVSVMVFLRYGRPRVALPMILTALSEVYILMAAAALLQYPVDLSVIAGFIAVIGTGVDDLIIIADRVIGGGSVISKTMFDKRFKKAFWVIAAAAITTIIAMTPLAFLSLGDLRGFAIFTVLGVVIGVLITRPAYGDILELIALDD